MDALRNLFSNEKNITTIVAILVAGGAHFGLHLDPALTLGLLGMFAVLIHAQGQVSHGVEAAKINAGPANALVASATVVDAPRPPMLPTVQIPPSGTAALPLLALVVLGALLFAGCHPSSRDTTIRTALISANAAEAGFVAWDRTHQHEIVLSATSRDEGEAKLAAYEAKSANAVKAFVALYQLIATAAVLNDSTSLASLITAATQLEQLVADLERSKP